MPSLDWHLNHNSLKTVTQIEIVPSLSGIEVWVWLLILLLPLATVLFRMIVAWFVFGAYGGGL